MITEIATDSPMDRVPDSEAVVKMADIDASLMDNVAESPVVRDISILVDSVIDSD